MAMKVIGVNPSKFHRSQIKFYIILAPIILFMMLPILYIVMHALKPIDELYLYPPRFFVQNPTLDNFARLFNQTGLSQIPVSRFLFNNIVIAISTVLATIYVSVSAGYALSKIRFRGRSTIFTINQLALMFVAVAVQIPRYLVITKIGLADNFLVHILPELAMPVGLFLVKQNIDQIPDSLIEAAEIDGATQFYVLRRVIVPLVKPALATVAILSFQAAWNSAAESNTFINNESIKSFAYYMTQISNTGHALEGQGMAAAAALLMFLPNLILFIVMQSRVMDTMTNAGIK